MIHFLCPYCRKSLKARPDAAGKRCKCSSCKLIVDIPGQLPNKANKPLDPMPKHSFMELNGSILPDDKERCLTCNAITARATVCKKCYPEFYSRKPAANNWHAPGDARQQLVSIAIGVVVLCVLGLAYFMFLYQTVNPIGNTGWGFRDSHREQERVIMMLGCGMGAVIGIGAIIAIKKR